MIITDEIKALTNKYIEDIFNEEELDKDSIWWQVLVDSYSLNIAPFYNFDNSIIAKILACYYTIMLNQRSKGSIAQGTSLNMGHISITGVNAGEGASVILAKRMLAELMPEDYTKIEVING